MLSVWERSAGTLERAASALASFVNFRIVTRCGSADSELGLRLPMDLKDSEAVCQRVRDCVGKPGVGIGSREDLHPFRQWQRVAIAFDRLSDFVNESGEACF
jgi:hypothetical protein